MPARITESVTVVMGRDASVAVKSTHLNLSPRRAQLPLLLEVMRIEELVLEGFKSYPVRTSITGWDASFNAITGLNGSGKSNILDAICFVLGITNMSQVSGSHFTSISTS